MQEGGGDIEGEFEAWRGRHGFTFFFVGDWKKRFSRLVELELHGEEGRV